ncbi:MAG: TonB family protein [Bacteroidetes bacterium]|nr:TonB family protein [Fibrella sp.]
MVNSFFNNSQLKSRIEMLINPQTDRRDLWKYALMMPLLVILVGLTAAREPLTEMMQATQPKGGITVSGRVVSEEGKPVPKATVLIVGSRRGTPTSDDGRFTLTDVPGTAMLAVSSVGFDTKLVPVKEQKSLVARLKRQQKELPLMGATAAYRAVGVNKNMPVSADPPDSQTVNGEVFTVVEQNPVFPDGIPGLMYYVAHNLRYPAEAQKAKIQGEVFVKFIVAATGAVNGVRVIKGIGKGCDEEAVRVVSQMPKWTPAKQYGKPVSVEYVLPIQFALEKQEDKRTGQIENRPTFSTGNADLKGEPDRLTGGSYAGDTVPTNKLDTGLPRYRLKTNFMRNGEKVSFFMAGKKVDWESPPLFVIDGVMSAKSDGLGSIKPDQILSIGVLKDESATAIYGEKGKNGVILITTKAKKP